MTIITLCLLCLIRENVHHDYVFLTDPGRYMDIQQELKGFILLLSIQYNKHNKID